MGEKSVWKAKWERAADLPLPSPLSSSRRFSRRREKTEIEPGEAHACRVNFVNAKLVLDPRPYLYQPVPMPKELSQVSILRPRYPDPRKAVFHQQLQQVLGILALVLLLPYSLRSNLGWISDPQLVVQLHQQTLEPSRVTSRFQANSHMPSLEIPIIAFRFPVAMGESSFSTFSCLGIHKRDLLKTWVVICSYN